MNIVIYVKPVPDPSIISLNAENELEKDSLVYMLNPSDLAAVEEAVRLKENDDTHSVITLSMAPPAEEGLLRRCLAIGADRAALLWDITLADSDSYAAGVVLAKAAESLTPDLILCGQKAIDSEMGFFAYVVAAQLGIPFVGRVVRMEILPNGKVMVESKLEKGNRERVEVGFPVVLGVDESLNEPRYASLPSLIAALRREVERYRLKELDLPVSEVGASGSKIKVAALSPPKPRPKRLFVPDSNLSAAERMRQVMSGGVASEKKDLFEGSPEELSRKFVKFLRQVNILQDGVA
jgi:electron transfer flavoprotein beta subunit